MHLLSTHVVYLLLTCLVLRIRSCFSMMLKIPLLLFHSLNRILSSLSVSYCVTTDKIQLIIYFYLWCYVPVLHTYVLDSPDKFVSELLYHAVVLHVSSLDSPGEFVGELLYYIVVPFFQDYPYEVVFERQYCVPAPSGT